MRMIILVFLALTLSPMAWAQNLNKKVVTFPEILEGQIAIQTTASSFEVLDFVLEQEHAFAKSCSVEGKKKCRAEVLKKYLSLEPKEISEACRKNDGESRIGKRYGVKRMISICYFSEDKSFVEI